MRAVFRPLNGKRLPDADGRMKGINSGWFLTDIPNDGASYDKVDIRREIVLPQSFVYDGPIELFQGREIVVGPLKYRNTHGNKYENIIVMTAFEKFIQNVTAFGDYGIYVKGIHKAKGNQNRLSGVCLDMLKVSESIEILINARKIDSLVKETGPDNTVTVSTDQPSIVWAIFAGIVRDYDMDDYHKDEPFTCAYEDEDGDPYSEDEEYVNVPTDSGFETKKENVKRVCDRVLPDDAVSTKKVKKGE